MLERINVISRNEIDSAYKDHVFFKLIRILCQPYVVSLKNFSSIARRGVSGSYGMAGFHQ